MFPIVESSLTCCQHQLAGAAVHTVPGRNHLRSRLQHIFNLALPLRLRHLVDAKDGPDSYRTVDVGRAIQRVKDNTVPEKIL